MKQLVCLSVCLALLLTSIFAEYDDGTVKSSLTYERTPYADGVHEAKAVLTVETAKIPKGRPTISLTAVVDISNSMDDHFGHESENKTRLDYVKLANKYVIDRLAVQNEDHKYGSVVFSSEVRELTPLQKMTKTTAEPVKKTIDDIKPFGYTNLLGGILRGIKQQASASNDDNVRAVLVFTDGRPTKGEIKPSKIYAAIKKAREEVGKDVLIHVIAVGEVKHGLLKEIANIGGGDFYHVSKEEDIPKAFAAVLGGLLTETALSLTYEIKPVGDLEVIDIQSTGAEIEWEDLTAICHMRDMYAEEFRAVVITYRLEYPMKATDGIDIQGTYRDPVECKDVEIPIGKTYPKREIAAIPPKPGPSLPGVWDFRQDVAKQLKKPVKSLEDGDVDGAIDGVDDVVVKIVASDHYSDPFVTSVVDDLKELRDKLEDDEVSKEKGRGMLEGLVGVVGGGRPASVDDDMLETVRDGLTTMQGDLMKESEDYADGKVPKGMFGLPFMTDVSMDDGMGVPEYKVKMSVGPPPVKETPPLSLTVVIDKDATGKDSNATFKKMTDVLKTVIKDYTSQPKSDVRIGVVLSSGSAKTVLDLTNTSDIDVDKIIADIDAFKPSGESAMEDGLKEGIRQQVESADHEGSHTVFLITDGSPSDGKKLVRDVKSQLSPSPHHIDIHTFGLKGSDGSSLKTIAETGDGEYHDLYHVDDLSPTVGGALWGLRNVKATNVEISVKPAEDGVIIKESLPAMTKKKDTYTVTFPDVYKGEMRDVMTTVKAPKGVKTLLNVTLTYTDVIDGKTKTSDVYTIDATPKGSTADRELDKKVLDKLKPAVEGGVTPSKFPAVVDAVYDTIPTVKDAKDVDEDYKDDMVDDLETVARKMEIAQGGTDDDIRDAEWTMETFMDTVKEQRAKGVGRPVLHVQDRHQPAGLRMKIKDYSPKSTTKEESKKMSEPVMIRYKDVVEELTTEKQELTVTMEIEAEKIPDEDILPSSFIFLVDTSTGTTRDDLAKVKDKVISVWESYKDTPLSDASYMEILVYSDGVYPVLHGTHISEIDEDMIDGAFDFAVLGGKGNFRDVFLEAMKSAKTFREQDSRQDVKMVAFVAGSIKTADKKADAQVFVDKTDEFGFPLKFMPVLMEGADASYFDAYPAWVQLSVIPDIAEFKTIRPSVHPIARRLKLIPNEKAGVEIVDVEDGIKEDVGYVIPDMVGKEKRTVDVKLKLPEDSSPQILRMPRLTMWDMRTQKKHSVHGEPLSIPRKSKGAEDQLDTIRSTIRDAAVKIDTAVDDKNWPTALELASRTIGDIEESDVEDPDVDLVKTRLNCLAEDIYKIIGDDKDPDGAKLLSKSILKQLGAEESSKLSGRISFSFGSLIGVILVEPEVPDLKLLDKKVMWPGKRGPGYSREGQKPPELIYDDGLRLKSTTKKMIVPLTIRAPRHKGDLVDAQVIILMDNSADADWKHERDLAVTLLQSLSKRQGKRAVGIWTWNDATLEIYFNKDFLSGDLNDAVAAIDAASLGGVTAPVEVLKLVQAIQPIKRTVSVVYWMVTTQLPDIDDSHVNICIKSLQRPTSPTLITFKPEQSGKEFDVLDRISDASGGHCHPTFPSPKVPETDAQRKIEEDGWKAVDWIEKTYSKNAKVKIYGNDGAKVVKMAIGDEPVVDVEAGIDIPSMKYGDEKHIDVILDTSSVTKPKSGVRDLLNVDGDFPYVRGQKPGKMERTVSVEVLKPRESSRVDTMYTMMDSAGWDLFYYLGRNRLKKALITAKEMQMQPRMAGIQNRPDMKKLIGTYKVIGDSIKSYISDKTDYKAIQNVSDIACILTKELPHYSDEGAYLTHKNFPPSMSSKRGLYHPRLTIGTPPWERPLPWKLYDHTQRIISIAAVFDTADHDILIDREMGSLTVQKMTVERIVRILAELDYTVDLQAVSSADRETSSLSVKRFNSRNIDDITAHLDQIKQKGKPANLVSSLMTGLPFVQDAVDSERMVLLFMEASSVGMVENVACEQLLMPYITYPINPVKVLTYIIGEGDNEDTDPISDLTGGQRMIINNVDDILNAVAKSIDCFDLHAARSIRVDVKTIKNTMNALEIAVEGEKRPLGIVGDMKHSSRQSVDLEMQLDESIGDEDIFEYTVSYYRPKYKRWFKTPTQTFRARRARNEVIQQQDRTRQKIVPILNTAVDKLKKGKIRAAALTVHQASKIAHRSLYQDDSLIRAVFDYLARCYEDIMKLSESRSKDTSEVEAYLKNEGCALGMNVGGECDDDLQILEYPEVTLTPSFLVEY